ALDVLPELLARGGQPAPARERGHHVGGGHLLAVVKLHAPAELERVGPALVADRVALDQQRDRVVAPVVGVERLVDVPGDVLHEDRGGGVQVEGRALPDHRRLEYPAGLGLLLSAERPDGGQGEREGQYENTSGETTHGGLLVL